MENKLALTPTELSYESLDVEKQKGVDAKVAVLQATSGTDLLTYGMEVQGKVTKYANEMLTKMDNTEKVENIDGIIEEALDVTKGLQVEPEKKGFLSRIFAPKTEVIPFDGSMFAGKVEKLVKAIEVQIGRLISQNIMYDDFIELLIKNVNDVTESIIALERYRAELQKESETQVADDSTDITTEFQKKEIEYRLQQLSEKINTFRFLRQNSMQVAVSARIIQNNNTVLSNRLQSLLVNGIPILQNQILLKASMLDTQKGLDMSDKVAESIHNAMKENATSLKTLTKRIGGTDSMPISADSVIGMSEDILSIAKELQEVNEKAKVDLGQMQEQLQQSDANLAEIFHRLSSES